MSTDCSASQSLVFPNVETLMDTIRQEEEEKKRYEEGKKKQQLLEIQKKELLRIQRKIERALRLHLKQVTLTCTLLPEYELLSDTFYETKSFVYPSMLDAILRAGFKVQSKEDSNNDIRFTITWD